MNPDISTIITFITLTAIFVGITSHIIHSRQRLNVLESTLAQAMCDLTEVEGALGGEKGMARIEMTARDSVTYQARIAMLEQRNATLRGDVDRLQAVDETLRQRLDSHDIAAGGGFWRTEDGFVLRIRDMSAHHLLNIHDGKLGSQAMLRLVELELRRRVKDVDQLQVTLAKAAADQRPQISNSPAEVDAIINYVRRILGDEPGAAGQGSPVGGGS